MPKGVAHSVDYETYAGKENRIIPQHRTKRWIVRVFLVVLVSTPMINASGTRNHAYETVVENVEPDGNRWENLAPEKVLKLPNVITQE